MMNEESENLRNALIEHPTKVTGNWLRSDPSDKIYALICAAAAIAIAIAAGSWLWVGPVCIFWIVTTQRRHKDRIYRIPLETIKSLKHQKLGKGVSFDPSRRLRKLPIPLQHRKVKVINNDRDDFPLEGLAFYHRTDTDQDSVMVLGEGSDFLSRSELSRRNIIEDFEQLLRRLYEMSIGYKLQISMGMRRRPIDPYKLRAAQNYEGNLAMALANNYELAVGNGVSEDAFLEECAINFPFLERDDIFTQVSVGLNQLETLEMADSTDCGIDMFITLSISPKSMLKSGSKVQKKVLTARQMRESMLSRLCLELIDGLQAIGVKAKAPNLADLRAISSTALSLDTEYLKWQAYFPQTANELAVDTHERLKLSPEQRRWTTHERERFMAAGGESMHWAHKRIVETENYCIVDGTYHSSILVTSIPKKHREYLLPSFWGVLNAVPVQWYTWCRVSQPAGTQMRAMLMGTTIIPFTSYLLDHVSPELPQQKVVNSQRDRRDQLYDAGVESRDAVIIVISNKTERSWSKDHDDAMAFLRAQGLNPVHLTGGTKGYQSSMAIMGTLGVPLML